MTRGHPGAGEPATCPMATSETSTPQVTDESEPAPTQTVVTQRVEVTVGPRTLLTLPLGRAHA